MTRHFEHFCEVVDTLKVAEFAVKLQKSYGHYNTVLENLVHLIGVHLIRVHLIGVYLNRGTPP
jgi:hypothetical protein